MGGAGRCSTSRGSSAPRRSFERRLCESCDLLLHRYAARSGRGQVRVDGIDTRFQCWHVALAWVRVDIETFAATALVMIFNGAIAESAKRIGQAKLNLALSDGTKSIPTVFRHGWHGKLRSARQTS